MTSGKLYTWPGNANAQAIQAVAALNGCDVEVVDFVPGTAPEGFPAHCTAPVFKSNDGTMLTQVGAILALLDGKCNHNTYEHISFAENVIKPAASAWVFPTLGAMPNNKGAIAEGKKSLLAALSHLNDTLATKTFLVGERPSAADAAVVASLSLAFKQVLAPQYRKDVPHVTRWFNTCVNQMSAFGAHQLCEKEAQFDGKTFGALNKKAGGDAQPKKQQKQEQKKPVEKKKPAPVLEVAAEPKKKDPWSDLGGDYDMDAWKRCYSNNDTLPTAMNYFWEHLTDDVKANYSCYYGKYKYGDEIALPFMASNLIRGLFQRIDKMRKHSFGSCCVFGGVEKGDIEISGVWFWKGQGLAFELSPDWQTDYDTYEWKKLDFNSEEDKKMITEYFAHEGEFSGKKFYEGKVWK
jgi:elongation factor 1-gamma